MTSTWITDNAAAYLTGDMNATLSLAGYAGDFVDDFDLVAADGEYAHAVEEVLAAYRPTWSLAGNFIVSPVEDAADLDEDELEALRADVADIDAAAILARHEVTA